MITNSTYFMTIDYKLERLMKVQSGPIQPICPSVEHLYELVVFRVYHDIAKIYE